MLLFGIELYGAVLLAIFVDRHEKAVKNHIVGGLWHCLDWRISKICFHHFEAQRISQIPEAF